MLGAREVDRSDLDWALVKEITQRVHVTIIEELGPQNHY